MNFQQQEEDKMLVQVIRVYLENKDDFDAVQAFGEAMQRLIATHTEIGETVEKQILDTKGTTKSKAETKANLVSQTFIMAGNIYSLAKRTNDTVMLGQSNLKISRLKKLNDQLIAPTCRNILNLAIANADALVNFGTTADNIQQLSQLIDAFVKLSGAPGSNKKDKSGLTQKLIDLFKLADGILADDLDKLVMNIQTTKPDTFKSYQIAREMPTNRGGKKNIPTPIPPVV